jgi:hypothetical protein
MYFIVATDAQGNPVVIPAGKEPASDELYAELEAKGWDIHTGGAQKITLAQARKGA